MAAANKVVLKPKVKLPPIPKRYKELAAKKLTEVVPLLIWKLRHQYPELAISITDHDITGLKACADYLEVTPEIRVEARPNYVMVRVTDAEGDAITVVENNEDDLQRGESAKQYQRLKASAPRIVAEARAEHAAGVISDDTIGRLCTAILTLARS